MHRLGRDPGAALVAGPGAGTLGVPRSWLADVRYFDQRRTTRTAQLDAVLPFLRMTCPPQRVLAVLEHLVKEERLTRDEATQVAACVLACVTAQGHWSWDQEQEKP